MVKSRYIGDKLIPPLIGILIMGPYKPLRNWVDDHPLLYGNNGSLDPGTYWLTHHQDSTMWFHRTTSPWATDHMFWACLKYNEWSKSHPKIDNKNLTPFIPFIPHLSTKQTNTHFYSPKKLAGPTRREWGSLNLYWLVYWGWNFPHSLRVGPARLWSISANLQHVRKLFSKEWPYV